jgi:thioredoxin 1
VRLDVDAHPEPAARFGVLSLPTVILFVGGRPRATVVGVRDERHFARTFGPWLEPAPGA